MSQKDFDGFTSPIFGDVQPQQIFSKNSRILSNSSSLSLEDFKLRLDRECIEGSAIAPPLYSSAIKIVSDLEINASDVTSPIHDALNWNFTRFGQQARATLHAALFLNEDGSTWQAKLSDPKTDRKKGKPRKYETPIGNGSRAFLPAIPISLWIYIAEKNQLTEFLPTWVIEAHANGQTELVSQPEDDRSFWYWVAQLPQAHITLTEGGKKALALLSQGEIAIALYGVNGGYRSTVKIAGEAIPLEKPELISDLLLFTQPDRPWILAFDQDTELSTRQKVDRALTKFGNVLAQTNAAKAQTLSAQKAFSQTVRVATWLNTGDQKGIDDLIVSVGVEAWHQAKAKALPLLQWQLLQNVTHRIQRKPNLSIGDQEFSTIPLDQLPKSGILAFNGGKGTAKTKAINPLLAGTLWLSLTPLQSLARHQADRFGGVFLNDGDQVGDILLNDGAPAQGITSCLHSLLKVSSFDPEILVLDEYTSILNCLLSSSLTNKNGSRVLLISEFIRRVQTARLVIVADADLTEEALKFLEDIRGERAYLVQSTLKALPYDTHILDGSKHIALASLIERSSVLEPNQLIVLNSDSKAFGQTLAKFLEEQGHKCLLINAETSSGELQSKFIQSGGKSLPELIRLGYKFIISSPSITQGFSIEHCTETIDSFWGFYFGGSITVEAIAQACDRIRDTHVPRFLHLAPQGRAYSRHSKATNPKEFLREFKSITTASARLVRHQLTPDAVDQSDSVDWNGRNLKMFAAIESQRNRGMKNLRESVIALLRHEGKNVILDKPSISRTEAQTVAAQFKAANQEQEKIRSIAIQNAPILTEDQAKILIDQKTAYSPEEILSLERYHIELFYRLEQTITTTDILFDDHGRTRRQITLLEMVLHPDNAIDRTRRSIEASPATPQDWKTEAGKSYLLEISGAADLVRKLVHRELEEWRSEDISAIATFMRDNAPAFRIAFGYSKLDNMADQQIFGTILSTLGLKTKRFRRRNTYALQDEHLTHLTVILKRRQDKDPPLLINDQINEGGSVETGMNENQKREISIPRAIPIDRQESNRLEMPTGNNSQLMSA
jgi:Domain of unknown function (DUF3854)